MAREIQDIQDDIITAVEADATLSGLNSTSKTAIWRLWAYIVAVAIWALEKLFDLHKQEVVDLIDNMKPHSLRWYSNKAKAFEYGHTLVEEEDYFEHTGYTEDEIAASKIVTNAAVIEQENNLRMKIAKTVSGDLASLGSNEMSAFEEYMSIVKDAGVRLNIESHEADLLQVKLVVYYDPMVLDGAGKRLDGEDDHPVRETIKKYLRNLPFNGLIVKAYLIDDLQQVEGIVAPVLQYMKKKSVTDVGYETVVDEIYNPYAGYARLESGFLEANVEYKAHGRIE